MKFQPTRPLRGATVTEPLTISLLEFQPTRPLRGATTADAEKAKRIEKFQPTRPLRGATVATGIIPARFGISTHAPLAGRDLKGGGRSLLLRISTHAPLAGRDASAYASVPSASRFQPTRPLRGATVASAFTYLEEIFQPTRPLRGATVTTPRPQPSTRNFNPRAPCGARLSIIIAKILTN